MLEKRRYICKAFLFLISLFEIANGGEIFVHVNQVVPTIDDEYICNTVELNESDIYVHSFIPKLNQSAIHHVILTACRESGSVSTDTCSQKCSESKYIYAWAHGAPLLQLPEGVSFRLGSRSGFSFIMIQIHFTNKFANGQPPDSSGIVLQYSNERTENTAGIYLMGSGNFIIEPSANELHVTVSCPLNHVKQAFTVFAVRVHAHTLGRAIGVFSRNKTGTDNHWNRIIETSAQRPHTFFPTDKPYQIDKNSELVARCVFDASATDHAVEVGSTRQHEMCNAYLMYYSRESNLNLGSCWQSPSYEVQLPIPDAVENSYKGEDNSMAHHHSHQHQHSVNIDDIEDMVVDDSEEKHVTLSFTYIFLVGLIAFLIWLVNNRRTRSCILQ